jgi:hypothetical protein
VAGRGARTFKHTVAAKATWRGTVHLGLQAWYHLSSAIAVTLCVPWTASRVYESWPASMSQTQTRLVAQGGMLSWRCQGERDAELAWSPVLVRRDDQPRVRIVERARHRGGVAAVLLHRRRHLRLPDADGVRADLAVRAGSLSRAPLLSRTGSGFLYLYEAERPAGGQLPRRRRTMA